MIATTDDARPAAGTASDAGESRVVRLSVNLAPTVAAALKSTAAKKGLSITEAIRHAIAVWKLVVDEQAAGRKVMIVEGQGDSATFREIVLI
ncbi:CopG family transcriptional regulator [Cellulomonas alba]|uniref:CopG family transcriptional regulator n=1 Tax=Cellulomonas alba TaxID=3053467 RepID=A0ABT7SH11_9CELL|nr:CopG family transcriptional regulator [Cellulomonas alba]MDM7855488.1 CopG family transcriptional regulator [Cellulomonas alba]